MDKEAFQSLLVNLYVPDLEDEEQVKSKELKLLANSEQLLKRVYIALGTMNASQRGKALLSSSLQSTTQSSYSHLILEVKFTT